MSQPATWGIPLESAEPTVTPEAAMIRADDSVDALLSSHNGATRPTYAVQGTVWSDDDNKQYYYDGTSDFEIAINRGTPASATATGIAGSVAWDADFFYICTATDTWKRVAVATWA